MSTLIVSCVGRELVNGVPRYLNRHPNGKLLVERSIEALFPMSFDRTLIVILEEDEKVYGAKAIINSCMDLCVEVVMLHSMTSGPAETIYQTIKKANITGSIVIKDADNYLKIESLPNGNFVTGLDLNTWDRDIHNLRNKSFLIVNEQGNLLDIFEKQVCSDLISLGLYGFQKARDFEEAYERLNDKSYPITHLYVSHIIAYLIGYYGRIFHCVPALEYENWGNERLWKDMQRDYTMYFIDLDHILGDDGILSGSSKQKLLALQKRGASFVGYTVEDKSYKISALKILRDAGLHFIKVVHGCPYSNNKEIIQSEEMLNSKVIEL